MPLQTSPLPVHLVEKKILIYGSYGYSGRLIVDEAVRLGLHPVLGGRNDEKVRNQAAKKNLRGISFDIERAETLQKHINEFDLVLNCAGPFVHTALPLATACMATNTHYLDITGEIEVFEQLASRSDEAKKAGVVLMPGTGFDVVPSDCLAKHAAEQFPGADYLKLYIRFKGSFSAGSAATAIEHFTQGGMVRKNGEIKKVSSAYKSEQIDFGDRTFNTVTIPWGDVSTAWHSTGIPDIEVYMSFPEKAIRMMRYGFLIRPLMHFRAVRRLLTNRIRRKSDGPDEQQRKNGETRIVAKAGKHDGEEYTVLQISPEAYSLTAKTAVACALHVLDNPQLRGFQTPSKAFGSKFILEFDGVSRHVISENAT